MSTYEPLPDAALQITVERATDRMAALLLTLPHWQWNYTETLEAAKWVIAEAKRVGWNLRITDKP